MKRLIAIALLYPAIASAQTELNALDWAIANSALQPSASAPQGVTIPIQPVLPVPSDNGPWGRGYSIVTETRERRGLYDSDLTGSETVQRVVPNDATGRPLKGLNLDW